MWEIFWSRVEPVGECWEWQGTLDRHGYGRYNNTAAHRISWYFFRNFIPLHDLDHLCRNPKCVNPWHLEPVTRRVNLLRGKTVTARNAAATHCPHGHEYSPENTQLQVKRGTVGRKCKTCHRADQLARYHRQKAVV